MFKPDLPFTLYPKYFQSESTLSRTLWKPRVIFIICISLLFTPTIWSAEQGITLSSRAQAQAADLGSITLVNSAAQAGIESFDLTVTPSSLTFADRWETPGFEDPQYATWPRHIVVDSAGYIYIAQQKTIHKFGPDGQYLTQWENVLDPADSAQQVDALTIDSNDIIYLSTDVTVGTTNTYQIGVLRQYDTNGTLLDSRGIYNSWHEFYGVGDIAVDLDRSFLYVSVHTSFGLEGVMKFDLDDTSNNPIDSWGSWGGNEGEFRYPKGIALDNNGNVYVGDSGNDRTQTFDVDGDFLTSWPCCGDAIAIDGNENVYTVDRDNNRIRKYTTSGELLFTWGSEGEGDGQFRFINDIAVDADNNVYVLDSENYSIQKFVPENGITMSGDVDCDNDLDSVDALFALQYAVDLRSDHGSCPLPDRTTQLHAAAGDMNGDGQTNSVDALFMLQCAVGLPNPYCGVDATAPPVIAAENDEVVGSVDLMARQNGQSLTVQVDAQSVDVGAGTLELIYDSGRARLVNCTLVGQGACHEAEDGMIQIAFVDAAGLSGTQSIAELTFDNANVALREIRATVADSGGQALGVEITSPDGRPAQLDDAANQLFIPLINR